MLARCSGVDMSSPLPVTKPSATINKTLFSSGTPHVLFCVSAVARADVNHGCKELNDHQSSYETKHRKHQNVQCGAEIIR
ncbi:hypothetical protein ACHAWT_003942 [Skeletonema menzelii]